MWKLGITIYIVECKKKLLHSCKYKKNKHIYKQTSVFVEDSIILCFNSNRMKYFEIGACDF